MSKRQIKGEVPSLKVSALKEIKAVYTAIKNKREKIFANCSDERKRKEVREAYIIAHDAFWQASARTLKNNSEKFQNNLKNLQKSNAKLNKLLVTLKNINAIVEAMSEAAGLAAELAKLFVAFKIIR